MEEKNKLEKLLNLDKSNEEMDGNKEGEKEAENCNKKVLSGTPYYMTN